MNALMQYFQESASLHAHQLGFGSGHLNEINCYWVLSNFTIQITRLPRWNEDVQITTWPSGYNRVIATREFLGKDNSGDELFRAGSEWMMLDKTSGRPRNLKKLDTLLPAEGQKVLEDEMVRLQSADDKTEVETIRVPYSAIDLNGHVNNTEYVRWGLDALKRDGCLGSDIQSLQITYLSEVFEDDTLSLFVSNTGPYQVIGEKTLDRTIVFVMQLT